MKDPLWSATYELFRDVGRLLERASGRMRGGLSTAGIPAFGTGVPTGTSAAQELGLRQAFLPGSAVADLVKLRAEIRGKLDLLKSRLLENLTEREAYLSLFPITLHIDEEVQKLFQTGMGSQWPTLQKELFQIDNGGEAFYEQLDDLLRKPNTFPFIYQAYYLCLSAGFAGRYHGSPTKVSEYKAVLAQKIPMPSVERDDKKDSDPIVAERFPALQYAGAVALVFAVWGVLRVVASM